MTLAASLTALLAAWLLALARGGGAWLLLAGAGATLGALAKGPVAVLVPGLAAAALILVRRDLVAWRRLRPLTVLGLATGVAALWYVAAFLHLGPRFVEVVASENWLRFLDADGGGHGHSAFYLAPLALVGLLPWTPLLPLAAAPLAARPRLAAPALAAAWVVTAVVFFSLAAAKRSVYLLPFLPAVALLLGGGVASPPEGRLAALAAGGARTYAPALAGLGAIAAAYAAGLDPGRLVRPWLAPADAAGAEVLAAAAGAHRALLLMLAVATVAAALLAARATRRTDWPALVRVVAGATVAWVAVFELVFHPAIGRAQSLRGFMARVDRLVPADAALHAFYPPDPGLRFYAPRVLRRWPGRGLEEQGWLLLWERDWRRLRDPAGAPLPVVAVSEARQARRGHLALVRAARGPLRPVDEVAGPPAPPGLRRDSRRR
jgi:4-amino-4-deoxy-L-arabinose transferase-like glycosyltransferase